MSFFFWIFRILGGLVSLYTFVCLIRIILTWFPAAAYSKFGLFLARICDPYLNWFRRFGLFRAGALDFTPVIGIGVLIMVSSIFSNIAIARRLSVGVILGTIINVSWSIISSILSLLIILIFIRFIFDLINKNGGSQAWSTVDNFLRPLTSRLSGVFAGKRLLEYRTMMIVSLIILIVAAIILGWFVSFIVNLLYSLPV